MLDQVLAEIERRERFVLTSHDRADGDAVGSSLACQEILRRMGKRIAQLMASALDVGLEFQFGQRRLEQCGHGHQG